MNQSMWLDGVLSIIKTQVEWFSKNMPWALLALHIKAFRKYSQTKIFMPHNNHKFTKSILASKNLKPTKFKNSNNLNKNMKFWEILTFKKNLPVQVFIKKYIHKLHQSINLILKSLFHHQAVIKNPVWEKKISVDRRRF